MEKEYLLMVTVTVATDVSGGLVKVKMNEEEYGFFDPCRLIDPADLDYDCPKRGETFLNLDGRWIEAGGDFSERCLILRKSKDKWQEWADRCPFAFATEEDKNDFAAWIEERFEMKEEKP